MSNLVDKVIEKHSNPEVKNFPDFRTGDTLNIHVRITEGAKSRIQQFQGTCIAIKRKGHLNGHFQIRKISNGIGVERVFPFHSPAVAKIEVVTRGKARRAKQYYLRDLAGKAARIAQDYSRE